jgi:transposase
VIGKIIEEYPGSVNDVSQLQYMIGKAHGYGYKNIGFILDRGYFSKNNIDYMDTCGHGGAKRRIFR